jgi:hypothetical protein
MSLLALGACSSDDTVAPDAGPKTERTAGLACDGNPNWCVSLSNEIRITSLLYVDGVKVAEAGPEQTVRYPVRAGETHKINYCRVYGSDYLFGLMTTRSLKCRTPETVLFDGNKSMIIYDDGNFR